MGVKRIVGFILIILAIFIGVYGGGWLCLIRGVLDIIFAFPVNGGPVTIGLVLGLLKIVFALPGTLLFTYVVLALGLALFHD